MRALSSLFVLSVLFVGVSALSLRQGLHEEGSFLEDRADCEEIVAEWVQSLPMVVNPYSAVRLADCYCSNWDPTHPRVYNPEFAEFRRKYNFYKSQWPNKHPYNLLKKVEEYRQLKIRCAQKILNS
uniref:Uncharacterized protein n=1 Tax=Chromera velia CCMP2878 TaxID=1169474 RepID=A0A0G4HTD9_9ALVE|eukprot:Cvel_8433.t1-p1 / transcript=Cvel_8433.t1 / gene=Cvel_8433 / organism=Chromera_velia_CCMP2878 / gene_product=hypothetical protein / transcript_product=hypothetical protein / location=Cvel_scaffold465:82721-83095(-) / protein_length=125 / sequence_SO=supercontig / SO=protein_coding / is_pseudo=false